MRIFNAVGTALGIAALATIAYGAPPVAPLSVVLQQKTVTVAGVSPGGEVTILADQIEPRQFEPALIHIKALLNGIGGQAQLTLREHDVQRSSVWIAIDNKTGAYGVALPPGSLFHEVLVPSHDLVRNGKGDVVKMDVPFTIVDLLVVRPAVGAWHGTIADGSADDDDPKPNGRTGCDVAKLKQLGKIDHGALDKLKNDDVVVGIDPASATYFVTRVGGN